MCIHSRLNSTAYQSFNKIMNSPNRANVFLKWNLIFISLCCFRHRDSPVLLPISFRRTSKPKLASFGKLATPFALCTFLRIVMIFSHNLSAMRKFNTSYYVSYLEFTNSTYQSVKIFKKISCSSS